MNITTALSSFLSLAFSFYSPSTCSAQSDDSTGIYFNAATKEYTVVVNKETMKKHPISASYPAVVLSLRYHKFMDMNVTSRNIEAPENREQLKMEADLWIEPRDPEIAILPEDSSRLKVTGLKWELCDRKHLGDIVFDEESIVGSKITPGTVFLLKKDVHTLFKIIIDKCNKQNEEITLRYRLVE